MINLIVAVDKNWAIGNKGDLLVSIPEDMKYFKEITSGNVVIMGRKTLESFPNGLPLKNRINIVISKKENYQVKDAIIVKNIEDALSKAKEFKGKEIYVIGGGSIYKQMLDVCDCAYVTYVEYVYEADTHFPNLDTNPQWRLAEDSEEQTYFDITYYFRKYIRKQ